MTTGMKCSEGMMKTSRPMGELTESDGYSGGFPVGEGQVKEELYPKQAAMSRGFTILIPIPCSVLHEAVQSESQTMRMKSDEADGSMLRGHKVVGCRRREEGGVKIFTL